MKAVEKNFQQCLLCNFSFLFYVNIPPLLRGGEGLLKLIFSFPFLKKNILPFKIDGKDGLVQNGIFNSLQDTNHVVPYELKPFPGPDATLYLKC